MFLGIICAYLVFYFMFSGTESVVYVSKNDEKEDPYQYWDDVNLW